jgi:hypothetical protein
MEESGHLHVLAALPLGIALDKRRGGPQSQSVQGSKKKNSLPFPGIKLQLSSPWPSQCAD